MEFDLVIVGAGPGGYETALTAAANGLRVALVERDLVGGTCLNRGCIPTKALLASVAACGDGSSVSAASRETEEPSPGSQASPAARAVETLRTSVETLLEGNGNIALVRGQARFVAAPHGDGSCVSQLAAETQEPSPRVIQLAAETQEPSPRVIQLAAETQEPSPGVAVEVNGECYSAPRVIIATGSRPRLLPIPGAELCDTSDDVLRAFVGSGLGPANSDDTVGHAKARPYSPTDSIVIIGGGVIGLEFAVILHGMGHEVTVVEYCKEVLPPFDRELAKRLRTALTRRGIKFVVGAAVTEILNHGDGYCVSLAETQEPSPSAARYLVTYEAKGKTQTLEADRVVMAVGRAPVLPEGLDVVGVAVERGAIVVDDNWRTTVHGVWAIGDVNARCMLAHAASAQGHNVLCQFINGLLPKNADVVPSVVFTTPELAMVGLTEQQAADAGLEVDIRRTPYRANGKAVATGETEGLVKMLVDRTTGRVAGCHILGAHAADLIHEVAVVMANDLPATALSRTVHAHPTLSELLALSV